MTEAQNSLWDSVNVDEVDKPKIVFGFNTPVIVEFPVGFEKPREYDSQYDSEGTKKYCVFDVIHNSEPAVITTSAYSLLRGLKKLAPLSGKKVSITKKLDKGKQQYVVDLAK